MLAKVKLTGQKRKSAYIPVTSEKPEIPECLTTRWQKLLNRSANLLKIPAALIMKVGHHDINVFLSSESEDNPYKEGDKEELGMGLYCETVMGTKKPLLVKNALKDENWKANPDVKLNMISYYGLPITWPDGELFGTFCVLDNKENPYSKEYQQFVADMAKMVQQDIKEIAEKMNLEEENEELKSKLMEFKHRVKNHLNSIISMVRLEKYEVEAGQRTIEDVLNSIETRVNAIVQVHDKLSMTSITDDIPLKKYLIEIGHSVVQLTDKEVCLNIHVDESFTLKGKKVILLGLLINELLTNSIKHAFKGVKNPVVNLNVIKEGDKYLFTYGDNGSGIPENYLQDASDSLGSMIIKDYSEQLGSGIEVSEDRKQLNFTVELS